MRLVWLHTGVLAFEARDHLEQLTRLLAHSLIHQLAYSLARPLPQIKTAADRTSHKT